MKCFNHIDQDAIGSCKSCCKGLCVECAHDTGEGLACKETCINDVKEINEIMDRSKKIYSIGTKAPLITSGVMVYFLFAALFGGIGVYDYLAKGRLKEFTFIMSFGFIIIGVYVLIKNRKLKLNC